MKTALLLVVGLSVSAGVLVACSSSDDTPSSASSSSSTSSSSGGSTTPTDSSDGGGSGGGGGGGGGACTTYPAGVAKIDNPECHACLETYCCAEISACFGLFDDAASGKQGADNYNTCLLGCDKSSDPPPDLCKGFCKEAARPEVPAAYDAFLSCNVTNCESKCTVAPDGGAP